MTRPLREEVDERIDVGALTLSVLRPRDAESLIDEEAFDADEFLPYWAEVWPSGVALARHVAGLELAGLRVLELGCGLGLPSLAAGLGGADVLATDWAEDALELLRRNAARNGVAVRTGVLRWEEPDTLAGASFDLVLAADVLYESRNAAPLLALLGLTVEPGGVALVSDPGRRHAGAFFAAARRGGWKVDALPAPELTRGAVSRLTRGPGRPGALRSSDG